MSQKDKRNPDINFKLSSNNMSKIVKRNVKFLNGFIANSKVDIKDNIKTIIQLYEDRKISNITTAENMIVKS